MARNESAANQALQAQAQTYMTERARWAAVLATPARQPRKVATKRRGLIARLLGL